MRLQLTPEQEAISDAFARFCAAESPSQVVRDAQPLGFDATVWQRLLSTGLAGMALTERDGGAGGTLLDVTFALHHLGRALAPVPAVEHVVATRLLAATTDRPWLAEAAAGRLLTTSALHPATPQGVWELVPAGAVADVVLGLRGDELVAVRGRPPMAAPPNQADAPLADRSASGADDAVVVLASGEAAVALHRRARAEYRTLMAAVLVGLAERALEIGVEYALQRHQFDRPIGAFQAVQQGLADQVAPIDGAGLLTRLAAWEADTDQAGFEQRAAMAWLFTTETARRASRAALHYHGGYGLMEEYDIQLYFRRARGWSLVDGDPEQGWLAVADDLLTADTR